MPKERAELTNLASFHEPLARREPDAARSVVAIDSGSGSAPVPAARYPSTQREAKDDLTSFTFRIPVRLNKRLNAFCKRSGVVKSDLVRDAIVACLLELDSGPK